jgi:hypothetical protein
MPGSNQILLSTAYLPNIQYFSKILIYNDILIEVHENYQKQSYRNRTIILGANGPLNLVIPIKKPDGNNTKTRDIIIEYNIPWQDVHWKSIVSAYKNSPYFDIYEEEIKPLYKKNEKFLLDWNFQVLNKLLAIIGDVKNYSITESYKAQPANEVSDYRNTIHPKKRRQKPDPYFEPIPYFQVFMEKYGFIPNLSFIDLLFNEGPQATYICRSCNKK